MEITIEPQQYITNISNTLTDHQKKTILNIKNQPDINKKKNPQEENPQKKQFNNLLAQAITQFYCNDTTMLFINLTRQTKWPCEIFIKIFDYARACETTYHPRFVPYFGDMYTQEFYLEKEQCKVSLTFDNAYSDYYRVTALIIKVYLDQDNIMNYQEHAKSVIHYLSSHNILLHQGPENNAPSYNVISSSQNQLSQYVISYPVHYKLQDSLIPFKTKPHNKKKPAIYEKDDPSFINIYVKDHEKLFIMFKLPRLPKESIHNVFLWQHILPDKNSHYYFLFVEKINKKNFNHIAGTHFIEIYYLPSLDPTTPMILLNTIPLPYDVQIDSDTNSIHIITKIKNICIVSGVIFYGFDYIYRDGKQKLPSKVKCLLPCLTLFKPDDMNEKSNSKIKIAAALKAAFEKKDTAYKHYLTSWLILLLSLLSFIPNYYIVTTTEYVVIPAIISSSLISMCILNVFHKYYNYNDKKYYADKLID